VGQLCARKAAWKSASVAVSGSVIGRPSLPNVGIGPPCLLSFIRRTSQCAASVGGANASPY
jgi:hypothetical protein